MQQIDALGPLDSFIPPTPSTMFTQQQVDALLAAAQQAAIVPPMAKPPSQGTNRTPGVGPPSIKRTNNFKPTPGYCWFHGTGSHIGTQCRPMAAGNSSGYTDAHRRAVAPVIIMGQPGAPAR